MFENRFLQVMNRLYSLIIKAASNFQSLFLLYMRLVWGHQFLITGIAKFQHIDLIIQFFTTLHIAKPHLVAYTVASFEVIGGFCLFFGFASRLLAIPLIVILLSALSLAHQEAFIHWRFLFEPMLLVKEAPYPFLITAVIVLIFGPGKISVDGWIKHWVSRQPKF